MTIPFTLGLALLALLPILASCGVPVAGVTGVGLDETGQLVGYIQMCDHHVDAAVLYRTDDSEIVGRWRSEQPVTGFTRWSLADPSDGWILRRAYSAPTDDEEYSLYGGTHDDSWSTRPVWFRLSDLSGLTPGEVLYRTEGELAQVSEADFRLHACDLLGGSR